MFAGRPAYVTVREFESASQRRMSYGIQVRLWNSRTISQTPAPPNIDRKASRKPIVQSFMHIAMIPIPRKAAH